ncbi:MAG TPA: hypothetical protein VL337_11295 [Acidimicrobiales bacterium]|nr:hypothetical protein [Acidimicrobiales bacterium]
MRSPSTASIRDQSSEPISAWTVTTTVPPVRLMLNDDAGPRRRVGCSLLAI